MIVTGIQPTQSGGYHAGSTVPELEMREIDLMLKANVIEPARTKMISQVAFVLKQNGTLHFCGQIENGIPS